MTGRLGKANSLSFAAVGRLALPNFQRLVAKFVERKDSSSTLVQKVATAVVESSKFFTLASKKTSLGFVQQVGLQNTDIETQWFFNLRLSYVLLASGDANGAAKVVDDFIEANAETVATLKALQRAAVQQPRDRSLQINSHRRLNAIYGRLLGALAMARLENSEFEDAISVLNSWQPFPGPDVSVFETRVQLKLLSFLGLVHTHMQEYDKAKLELLSALNALDRDHTTPIIYDVMSYFGDACLELGQPQEAIEHIEPALQWTKATECLEDRHHRNLVVTYAEACILVRKYAEAERHLQALVCYFREKDLGVSDQRKYVRALILLAQIAHYQALRCFEWADAMQRWTQVTAGMSNFVVLDSKGWDFGVVCLSMSHVAFELARKEEYTDWRLRAAKIFESEGHFWIRGFGTYWFDFIVRKRPEFGYLRPKTRLDRRSRAPLPSTCS